LIINVFMNDASDRKSKDPALPAAADLAAQLAAAQAEIARLNAEFDDLKMLYEAMIEHGEAVEDQLAESNLTLQNTQARLEAELSDAARYVMSILPDPRATTPMTEWLLVPSTELGGDSFGYHAIDDDHMAFYLLDVCGHGVGAALLSVTVINVLRAAALPKVDFRDPSLLLASLNDAFPMERQNNMFFTIWYGVYKRSSGELRYATGGHPPAIHLRRLADGTVASRELITFGGMAIGAFPGVEYECASIQIDPGDRLLILSDGTFEVDGPEGDMLSVAELAAFAAGQSDSPQAILEWVRSFNGGGTLPDDFSLLKVTF
jgi:sigma-B regulation protein RsbU (phosphoserine phosphatase)